MTSKGGFPIVSGYLNGLVAGDVISMKNSTINPSSYTVSAIENATMAHVIGLNGTESLLSRVVKELKG